jgi:hypothetical protein
VMPRLVSRGEPLYGATELDEVEAACTPPDGPDLVFAELLAERKAALDPDELGPSPTSGSVEGDGDAEGSENEERKRGFCRPLDWWKWYAIKKLGKLFAIAMFAPSIYELAAGGMELPELEVAGMEFVFTGVSAFGVTYALSQMAEHGYTEFMKWLNRQSAATMAAWLGALVFKGLSRLPLCGSWLAALHLQRRLRAWRKELGLEPAHLKPLIALVPAKEVQSLLRDPEGGLDKTLRTLTEKRDEYQSRVKGLDDHLEMLRERPTQAATQQESRALQATAASIVKAAREKAKQEKLLAGLPDLNGPASLAMLAVRALSQT